PPAAALRLSTLCAVWLPLMQIRVPHRRQPLVRVPAPVAVFVPHHARTDRAQQPVGPLPPGHRRIVIAVKPALLQKIGPAPVEKFCQPQQGLAASASAHFPGANGSSSAGPPRTPSSLGRRSPPTLYNRRRAAAARQIHPPFRRRPCGTPPRSRSEPGSSEQKNPRTLPLRPSRTAASTGASPARSGAVPPTPASPPLRPRSTTDSRPRGSSRPIPALP